jgi:GNAT superfamily N-acetyltransferase
VTVRAPEPLGETHDTAEFASGVDSLDDWLRRRARANQASGASRTFVVTDRMRVIGYYALASGAVVQNSATSRLRRNMPDPIPIVVLGRLAVDRDRQGTGLGGAMFRDAARRVLQAANLIGIRGILVHAISEEARRFYLSRGFEPSMLDPMTLMVRLADIEMAN